MNKCSQIGVQLKLYDGQVYNCCHTKEDENGIAATIEDLLEDNNKYCKTCAYLNTVQYQEKIFNIKFGNLCNSKCLTCLGHAEKVPLLDTSWDIIEREISYRVNTFDILYFVGGETLLYEKEMIDTLKLLDTLDFNTIKEIVIITNGSILLSDELIKYLSKSTAKIVFYISVDGDANTNHLLRPGCNMEKVSKTMEQCRNLGFHFRIAHTISILNVFDLERNLDYYYNILKCDDIIFQFVACGEFYSIMNIKKEIKNKLYLRILKQKFPKNIEMNKTKILSILVRNETDLTIKLLEELKSVNEKYNILYDSYLNRDLIELLGLNINKGEIK